MAAGDSLGNQFGGYHSIVEHVPIHEVKRFRDPSTDREAEGPGRGYSGEDRIQELHQDIAQHGVKEPLYLLYGQRTKTAILGEGHHRLAAAERAGHQTVPVRVIRQSSLEGGVRVPGAEPNEHGYVRGDLRPSEIGVGGRSDWKTQIGV